MTTPIPFSTFTRASQAWTTSREASSRAEVGSSQSRKAGPTSRADEGEALLLTDREDRGVVLKSDIFHEHGVQPPAQRLLIGRAFPIGDAKSKCPGEIVGDAAVDAHGRLLHPGQGPAQAGDLPFGGRHTVGQHVAAGGILESIQQV